MVKNAAATTRTSVIDTAATSGISERKDTTIRNKRDSRTRYYCYFKPCILIIIFQMYHFFYVFKLIISCTFITPLLQLVLLLKKKNFLYIVTFGLVAVLWISLNTGINTRLIAAVKMRNVTKIISHRNQIGAR